jgi:hypothetical protein
MAEPMQARIHARPPANRRPRIPHPHLAPQPERPERKTEAAPPAPEPPVEAAEPDFPDTAGWTPVDVPLVRHASRSRRGFERPSPAEKTLRSALHAGLAVNLAVLLASRLLPAETFGGWSYHGDDFLLAAAVLLSGYALLAAGRLSRRDDRGERGEG